MNWRKDIKYPGAEGHGSRKGVSLMDTLNEILPYEPFSIANDSRTMKFCRWIDAGEKAGILTIGEAMDIRQELIHGCGGL